MDLPRLLRPRSGELSAARRGLVAAALGAALAAPLAGQTTERSLTVGTASRTYLLHVPPGLPKDGSGALVVVLHGRGGDAVGIERLTGFSELADRAGFAVAYPDGISRSWNDGRAVPATIAWRSEANDVGFISLLIDSLTAELHLDPQRIFAAGFSNGAVLAHRLAARLATRIAAIATVSGGIAAESARDLDPAEPVSVFVMQGTRDPLVPFDGGPVAGGRLGRELGADSTALLWEENDGIRAAPATGTLPDLDGEDGCVARWWRWSGGRRGTEVWLYALEGGGHTWPGGRQYRPAHYVGTVCRDFSATFAIWDFFTRHAKQPPRPEVP